MGMGDCNAANRALQTHYLCLATRLQRTVMCKSPTAPSHSEVGMGISLFVKQISNATHSSCNLTPPDCVKN